MTLTEVFKFVGAILISVGGASGIIIALSSWFGKVWANKILESDKARYNRELEELRARLTLDNQRAIDNLHHELEIYQEKYLKEHKDKIEIYRLVINIISDVLADLDIIYATGVLPPDAGQRFDAFNRSRLKAYGYLAMMAPQNVIDANDKLTDYLFSVKNGREPYVWSKVRELGISLLNEIRKDIGIDKSPIEYRGIS